MSCEISFNNGMTFSSGKYLYIFENVCKIEYFWEEIINYMDRDIMEDINSEYDFNTDTIKGKVEYLETYLEMCENNIIIG